VDEWIDPLPNVKGIHTWLDTTHPAYFVAGPSHDAATLINRTGVTSRDGLAPIGMSSSIWFPRPDANRSVLAAVNNPCYWYSGANTEWNLLFNGTTTRVYLVCSIDELDSAYGLLTGTIEGGVNSGFYIYNDPADRSSIKCVVKSYNGVDGNNPNLKTYTLASTGNSYTRGQLVKIAFRCRGIYTGNDLEFKINGIVKSTITEAPPCTGTMLPTPNPLTVGNPYIYTYQHALLMVIEDIGKFESEITREDVEINDYIFRAFGV